MIRKTICIAAAMVCLTSACFGANVRYDKVVSVLFATEDENGAAKSVWPFEGDKSLVPPSYKDERQLSFAGVEHGFILKDNGLPIAVYASDYLVSSHKEMGFRMGKAAGNYIALPALSGYRITKIAVTAGADGNIGALSIQDLKSNVVSGGEAWTEVKRVGERHEWLLDKTSVGEPLRVATTRSGNTCIKEIRIYYTKDKEAFKNLAAQTSTVDNVPLGSSACIPLPAVDGKSLARVRVRIAGTSSARVNVSGSTTLGGRGSRDQTNDASFDFSSEQVLQLSHPQQGKPYILCFTDCRGTRLEKVELEYVHEAEFTPSPSYFKHLPWSSEVDGGKYKIVDVATRVEAGQSVQSLEADYPAGSYAYLEVALDPAIEGNVEVVELSSTRPFVGVGVIDTETGVVQLAQKREHPHRLSLVMNGSRTAMAAIAPVDLKNVRVRLMSSESDVALDQKYNVEVHIGEVSRLEIKAGSSSAPKEAYNRYQIFEGMNCRKPLDIPDRFSPADFVPSAACRDYYKAKGGTLFASPQTIDALYSWFVSDPEGIRTWNQMSAKVASQLGSWKLVDRKDRDRFAYAFDASADDFSFVYLFTRDESILRFMRQNMLIAAQMPLEFWHYSELGKTTIHLATSHMIKSVSLALAAMGDDMPASEVSTIQSSMKTKAIDAVVKWIDTPRRINNFLAVMSTGLFMGAKQIGDAELAARGLKEMRRYIDATIEADGSYGEGVNYYEYPIGQIMKGVPFMTTEEFKSIFEGSGVYKSPLWLANSYRFCSREDGSLTTDILNFSDNESGGSICQRILYIASTLGDNPLGTWMLDNFTKNDGTPGRTIGDCYLKLAMLQLGKRGPDGISPTDLGLPLTGKFDNGDCFIRSDWGKNPVAFGLRSGDGAKTLYSHQRPEKHSILLSAYGEYLIIAPGSSSYRSPIHKDYDTRTRAANTIGIDGADQIAKPVSTVTVFEDAPDHVLIRAEGNGDSVYQVPMQEASRTVLYVKDGGFFIVKDVMKTQDGSAHSFQYRYHFDNHDSKAKLTSPKDGNGGTWKLERPNADMYFAVYCSADSSPVIGKGYMHGAGTRDYNPGGPNEGKLGSSIEWTMENSSPESEVTFTAVLYPCRKGVKSPAIVLNDNIISINGIEYTL